MSSLKEYESVLEKQRREDEEARAKATPLALALYDAWLTDLADSDRGHKRTAKSYQNWERVARTALAFTFSWELQGYNPDDGAPRYKVGDHFVADDPEVPRCIVKAVDDHLECYWLAICHCRDCIGPG